MDLSYNNLSTVPVPDAFEAPQQERFEAENMVFKFKAFGLKDSKNSNECSTKLCSNCSQQFRMKTPSLTPPVGHPF